MSLLSALRPASFAGVPIYVKTTKLKAGQRLIEQEIPFAPTNFENQGLLPRKFTISAYVIGASWLLQMQLLLRTLESAIGVQTLVLPTFGPVNVRVATYTVTDDEAVGNFGAVDIEFVVDNSTPAPLASSDSASALLAQLDAVGAQVATAYAQYVGPLVQQAAIAAYAASLLTSAAGAVAGLPAVLLSGVSLGFASTPTSPASTASVVGAAFTSISNNAVALANPTAATVTPVAGYVPATPLPADPTLGLGALAAWNNNGTPAASSPAGLASVLAATSALVQQNAALAVVALFGQTNFTTAQAASAARTALKTIMANTGAAIVDAGHGDLFRAWCALTALATQDMIARAQNLPSIATYKVKTVLPDVVLAQILLQKGNQGPALAALNNVVHPLFMPTHGHYVAAA